MKIKALTISVCAAALLLCTGVPADGQSRKKAGSKKENGDVRVRAWMNKGETKTIDGYLRSSLVNRPDHIEISLTPGGERTRYINEDVDSLLLEGTDKYVKRLVKVQGPFGGSAKVEWVREEYCGKGIDLYSLFTVESEKINNVTRVSAVHGWYMSIGGDVAIQVGTSLFGNIFDRDEPPMYKDMLGKYFGKIYDYPEFAARIKAGEFQSLMEVVNAWEASYAYTAERVDGKLKEDQTGVQGGIAASDASKDMAWKRTGTEIVFPKYARTIQAGVSPAVASWASVMKHAGKGDKSSCKTDVPPIMIYSDICFLDFGRFGGIGWTIGAEYSRYSYNWMLDNGYGDRRQDTFCNRVDLAAGLSYHLTLCRNLEVYARGMIDAGIIGEHTKDHESGEKASSTFNKMDTKMTFVGVAGLRWYFCRNVGLWAEGGHNTGYVAAGLSFRY